MSTTDMAMTYVGRTYPRCCWDRQRLSHIFMDTVYDYESKLLIVIKMRTSFNRYFEFWRVFYVNFLFLDIKFVSPYICPTFAVHIICGSLSIFGQKTARKVGRGSE